MKPPAHIPVILFSANNEIETIAERVNAEGYIHKPFDIKSLVNIVSKYAGLNKPAGEFQGICKQADILAGRHQLLKEIS